MTKFIICGFSGKMGTVLESMIDNRDDCQIVAGVDNLGKTSPKFPTYTSFSDIKEEADVIVDFSNSEALGKILDYIKVKRTPAVLCTTGYSKQQIQDIKKVSEVVPIFCSRNMSLCINLLIKLSKEAFKVLGSNFDIEIVEKHHNKKVDAPSGTALMIADELSKDCNEQILYSYDRHCQRKPRSKNEIGIHSIRGGNIVGDHETMFIGEKETLSISHNSQSREIYAEGALKAAKFIIGKPNGLYGMDDLLQM